MKTVTVELGHLDLDKGTCLRCSKTGKIIEKVFSAVIVIIAMIFIFRYFGFRFW